MMDALQATAGTDTARKLSKATSDTWNCQLPETDTAPSSLRLYLSIPLKTAILEKAILSLYAKGITVRDIHATLHDLYHVDVSPSLISKITDVINEEVEQWRDRPFEAVYHVVWLDGIVVKVHHDHQVLNKTIYLALAINMEVYKELLEIWIAEHEGA